MNQPSDRDGSGRATRAIPVERVTEARPDRDGDARPPRTARVSATPVGTVSAPVSPAAVRARRYRARKRGEDVPKRKPGPEPRSVAALSREVGALRRENGRLAAQLTESQALTPVLGMRRQRFTLAMVGRLRAALEASDPAKDAPALREALRDLLAAIEARHDYWPES